MSDHPVPELIAPGQESVWDYPRPPALRASEELITVMLGGEEICETRTSWRVLETSHPPTYYLPRVGLRRRRASTGRRPLVLRVEGRGRRTWTWSAGARSRGGPAGTTPSRPVATARSATTSRSIAGAMDRCLVDGEVVVPQEGGFYGGWITSAVSGPFKGGPGTLGW